MISNTYSAVIIAKNEDRTIGQCIQCLKEITEDIIVVLDDRSNDQTEEICTHLGAKIYKTPWRGYSANKNFGVDKAQNNWILCMDADELLNNKLIESIQNLKLEEDCAYKFNIQTYFGDYPVKHCGWFPDWNIRLFNKTQMRWNDNQVHEKLESKIPLREKKVEGLVQHLSFKDEAHMKEKFDYYAKLRAEEWIRQGKKPPLLKRIVGPEFRFFRTLILKRGLLDGHYGYIIAKNEYILKQKELKYWKALASR